MSATRPKPPTQPRTQPGTGKGAAKLPRHVSQEGRERLSQLARQRHQQDGGFVNKSGLPAKRRKPSKARIARQVAEAAAEKKNAKRIIEVFKDGVHDSQPMHIRIKAAEAWLRAASDDAKLAIRESDSESQRRDREELLSLLSEKLTSGHSAALLRRQLKSDDVIEGTVIDDD